MRVKRLIAAALVIALVAPCANSAAQVVTKDEYDRIQHLLADSIELSKEVNDMQMASLDDALLYQCYWVLGLISDSRFDPVIEERDLLSILTQMESGNDQYRVFQSYLSSAGFTTKSAKLGVNDIRDDRNIAHCGANVAFTMEADKVSQFLSRIANTSDAVRSEIAARAKAATKP